MCTHSNLTLFTQFFSILNFWVVSDFTRYVSTGRISAFYFHHHLTTLNRGPAVQDLRAVVRADVPLLLCPASRGAVCVLRTAAHFRPSVCEK